MPEPLKGVLGLHIIGDTGQSNDPAIAFARQLGGRYATVVNTDWKLTQPLLDSGIEVIARVKTTDWNDDDADNHQTGKQWANYLHNVYPDTRIYLTAGNELGDGTPERTQNWMMEFVEEAARLGHRTAGYHSHFLSPYRGYWATQTLALDALRAHEGLVCVHKGFAAAFREMPALRGQHAIDEDFSRILEILGYNVPVVVTEFTGSNKPDEGWEYLYRDANGGIDVQAALAEADLGLKWLADHGVYATYFTFYRWNNGRGFELHGDDKHKQDFRAGLVRSNAKYPVKEITMPDYPKPTGEATPRKVTGFPPNVPFRNIRKQPKATDAASDVGDLKVGDTIAVYFGAGVDGWFYIERGSDGAEGWVLFTGVETTSPDPVGKRFSWSEAEVNELRAYIDTFISKGVPSDSGNPF